MTLLAVSLNVFLLSVEEVTVLRELETQTVEFFFLVVIPFLFFRQDGLHISFELFVSNILYLISHVLQMAFKSFNKVGATFFR